jgi:hypothetical protein
MSGGASSSATQDPNESLRSAIGAYFSAPDSSNLAKGAAKELKNVLFSAPKGMSVKQAEQKLRLTFKWMDKDGSGEVILEPRPQNLDPKPLTLNLIPPTPDLRP